MHVSDEDAKNRSMVSACRCIHDQIIKKGKRKERKKKKQKTKTGRIEGIRCEEVNIARQSLVADLPHVCFKLLQLLQDQLVGRGERVGDQLLLGHAATRHHNHNTGTETSRKRKKVKERKKEGRKEGRKEGGGGGMEGAQQHGQKTQKC